MKTSIETLSDRTVVTTGNMETVFKGHCEEAAIQIATLQQRLCDMDAAIKAGGLGILGCMTCGTPVAWIKDGLPNCVRCAEEYDRAG